MGGEFDFRRRIGGARETVRRHPSLLVVGTLPVVSTVVGAVVAWFLAPPTASDPWSPVVTVAAAVGIVLVLRLVYSPAYGTVYPAVRAAVLGEEEVWGADSPLPSLTDRLILDAGFHSAVVVGALPVLLGLSAATFLAVGTPVEAVGYLVAGSVLYDYWVPVGPVVLSVLAIATFDGALAGLRVVDLRPPEMGRSERLRAAVASPWRAPGSALASLAVLATTTLLPYVVAVELILVGLELTPSDTLAGVVVPLAAGLVGFAAVGTLSFTFRTVHTVASARLFARRFDGGTPPDGIPDGRARTLALAALLVAGAVVGGGALRVADLRPAVGGGPPGDPTGKSHSAAVEAGIEQIPRTSYRAEWRLRNPDNGTVGGRKVWWRDRSGRRVLLLTVYPDEAWAVYVTDTTVAQTRTTLDGMRENASPAELFPEGFDSRESRFLASTTYGRIPTTAPLRLHHGREGTWTVARRSDDRLVLETADREAVARVLERSLSRIVEGNVRVVLDRSSGRILRVRKNWTARSSVDANRTVTKSVVWEFEYGGTRFPTPELPAGGVETHLYDLLLY